MKNINQKQARFAGIALIILGVVAIFDLWGLLPVALLAAGGIYIYRRQHSIGRVNEAVQALLWGTGLAFLLLIDALFPGVLLLGGASLLLRGNEIKADERVQRLLTQVRSYRRKPAAPVVPAAQTSTPDNSPVVIEDEQPRTGETVRL
jgi:hypothetical protein